MARRFLMVPSPITPLNAALVRACLGDAAALAAWEAGVDIEAHDAAMGAMLPLLYAAAERHGWALKHAARIAGVYRYWFARNQVSLAALTPLAAALQAGAIPAVLLDAPLLALAAYPRPALHPIERLTVLVRPKQAYGALRSALDLGWTPIAPLWPARIPTSESVPFQRDGLTLVLRWCAVDRRAAPGIDDALWQAAAPLAESPWCAPSPAHRLLWAALNPPQVWGQTVATLWQANLVTLLRAGVDWEALVTAAQHYRVTAYLHEALTEARALTATDAIPQSALDRLRPRPTWFAELDRAARQTGDVTSPRAHLVRWRGAIRGLTPYRAARRTARYLATAWARR